MTTAPSWSRQRIAGGAIALLAAIIAVAGITTGHRHPLVASGIAVIGIVVGTGVARGKFSGAGK